MSGSRLRRFLVLLIAGAIAIRAVRALRGQPTRAFDDRPRSLARPTADPGPPQAASIPLDPSPSIITSIETADTTDAAPDTGSPSWVAPVDGSCPDGYPVKAKLRSGIFHLPGMSAYERTGPDRCYTNAEAAVADGLRIAKR